jgi:putative nucleotidyltransferase with HDIG domain
MQNSKQLTFAEKIKLKLRRFFIEAALWVSKKPQKPAIRYKTNIFSVEIKVPKWVSFIVAFALIYTMLVMESGATAYNSGAAFVFLIILSTFFIVHVNYRERRAVSDEDAVAMMGLLFVLAVLLMQISVNFSSPIIFPSAAFALIAAMLLSGWTGFLCAITIAVFAGFIADLSFEIATIHLFSSVAGLIGFKKIMFRSQIVRAGVQVVLINIAVIGMFYLISPYEFILFEKNLVYGVLSGAISVGVILLLTPFLEICFSRVSNIKLVELSDFNSPLLKRLMLEAPGTYHHSLMTASIAEQAANAIGENGLFARVAAYYHDVGKLTNSDYFIENQNNAQNPHDIVTPSMSGLILVSHVKDGAALAKKYKIDKSIMRAIEEHHGTGIIQYFYQKALEKDPDTDISSFRYPGPKPTTKISVILMIADASEAASRTIEEPTASQISDMVNKIIKSKLDDGQFSESPITLRDLEVISESISNTIAGIYHARIEYKNQ